MHSFNIRSCAKNLLFVCLSIWNFSCNKSVKLDSEVEVSAPDQIVRTNSCRHTDSSFRCVTYVKNYDGDTITFNIPKVPKLFGKKISIRVLGLDTPEVRTDDPCEKKASKIAKDFVREKVEGAERIDLINVSRGKYFRVVADVIINKRQSLTALLLEKDLAYVYDGGTKQNKDWCVVVEKYGQ